MNTTNNDAPARDIVLPWRQRTLKLWKEQAARAIVEMRDMGLIEIKKPLADIKREFEQLMADPAFQLREQSDGVANSTVPAAQAEHVPTSSMVPWWVFEDEYDVPKAKPIPAPPRASAPEPKQDREQHRVKEWDAGFPKWITNEGDLEYLEDWLRDPEQGYEEETIQALLDEERAHIKQLEADGEQRRAEAEAKP